MTIPLNNLNFLDIINLSYNLINFKFEIILAKTSPTILIGVVGKIMEVIHCIFKKKKKSLVVHII